MKNLIFVFIIKIILLYGSYLKAADCRYFSEEQGDYFTNFNFREMGESGNTLYSYKNSFLHRIDSFISSKTNAELLDLLNKKIKLWLDRDGYLPGMSGALNDPSSSTDILVNMIQFMMGQSKRNNINNIESQFTSTLYIFDLLLSKKLAGAQDEAAASAILWTYPDLVDTKM